MARRGSRILSLSLAVALLFNGIAYSLGLGKKDMPGSSRIDLSSEISGEVAQVTRSQDTRGMGGIEFLRGSEEPRENLGNARLPYKSILKNPTIVSVENPRKANVFLRVHSDTDLGTDNGVFFIRNSLEDTVKIPLLGSLSSGNNQVVSGVLASGTYSVWPITGDYGGDPRCDNSLEARVSTKNFDVGNGVLSIIKKSIGGKLYSRDTFEVFVSKVKRRPVKLRVNAPPEIIKTITELVLKNPESIDRFNISERNATYFVVDALVRDGKNSIDLLVETPVKERGYYQGGKLALFNVSTNPITIDNSQRFQNIRVSYKTDQAKFCLVPPKGRDIDLGDLKRITLIRNPGKVIDASQLTDFLQEITDLTVNLGSMDYPKIYRKYPPVKPGQYLLEAEGSNGIFGKYAFIVPLAQCPDYVEEPRFWSDVSEVRLELGNKENSSVYNRLINQAMSETGYDYGKEIGLHGLVSDTLLVRNGSRDLNIIFDLYQREEGFSLYFRVGDSRVKVFDYNYEWVRKNAKTQSQDSRKKRDLFEVSRFLVSGNFAFKVTYTSSYFVYSFGSGTPDRDYDSRGGRISGKVLQLNQGKIDFIPVFNQN